MKKKYIRRLRIDPGFMIRVCPYTQSVIFSVIPTCSESLFKDGCWPRQLDKKKQVGLPTNGNDNNYQQYLNSETKLRGVLFV